MLTFLIGVAVGAAVTYLMAVRLGGIKPFWASTDDLRNPSKYSLADPDVARDLDDRDRELAALDPRWASNARGDYARFTYADRDGVVTERQISNWQSSGAYIEGVCLNRREGRTFRKDRINDWSAEGQIGS